MRIVSKGNTVALDLDCSVHSMPLDSATGKTALYYMAEQDTELGVKVMMFNDISDYERLPELESLPKNDWIFLFDRFDMFQTDQLWEYLRKSVGRCILVDSKKNWKIYDRTEVAYFNLTADGLEVYDVSSGRR